MYQIFSKVLYNNIIPEELYAKLTSVNEFTEEILILKGVKKSK